MLIQDAFLTDKALWELDLDRIRVELKDANEEIVKAAEAVKNENKIIIFIYEKILRRTSPAMKKYNKAKELSDKLFKKLLDIRANEPLFDAKYQLAELGNNIFKPR